MARSAPGRCGCSSAAATGRRTTSWATSWRSSRRRGCSPTCAQPSRATAPTRSTSRTRSSRRPRACTARWWRRRGTSTCAARRATGRRTCWTRWPRRSSWAAGCPRRRPARSWTASSRRAATAQSCTEGGASNGGPAALAACPQRAAVIRLVCTPRRARASFAYAFLPSCPCRVTGLASGTFAPPAPCPAPSSSSSSSYSEGLL
mmetsp:Transcript_85706/g.242695  ORF Transcript_85706/g.242695 Transcript_85706/m.242695 type:complete len:204 (-) Transcript_85706:426-1037(-)